MTITQTVDIPADHRFFFEFLAPREIPASKARGDGFVPRLDYSGTIQRQGHITKRGNGYLRGLLVQVTWVAVRSKIRGAGRTKNVTESYVTLLTLVCRYAI